MEFFVCWFGQVLSLYVLFCLESKLQHIVFPSLSFHFSGACVLCECVFSDICIRECMPFLACTAFYLKYMESISV